MFEVWKIQHGVQSLDAQLRDAGYAREHAIEQSRLVDAVYVVTREGFNDPLFFVYRGMPGDSLDVLRRLTTPGAPPVLRLDPPAPEVFEEPSGIDPEVNEVPRPRRRRGPTEMKAKSGKPDEYKTLPITVLATDEEQGIVEAIISVFGILDDGLDIVMPGSFSKTLAENFGRIKVLDSHNNRSALSTVGKPLEIREINRGSLPSQTVAQYSTATGGLYTKTQYAMKTEDGRDMFHLIADGFVKEYSIGFDATDPKNAKVKAVRMGDHEELFPYMGEKLESHERVLTDERNIPIVARFLFQNRLWEYSPVVWGMNPATSTVSVKSSDPAPADAKPYAVFPMNDEFCVFKVDENGERTGESLGCHATEDEANAQVAALYASEQDGKARKEYTPQGPQRRLGDCIMADMMDAMNFIMGRQLRDGMMSGEEHGQMMGMCIEHVNAMRASMPDDLAMRAMPDMPMFMFGADGATETKVGRVLSAANFGKIEQASTLLVEVLKAATSATDNEGTSGDKAKEPITDNQDGPHETTETPTPDATGAGPSSDEAPAIDADSLLLRFQQLVGDISILEGKT